MIQEQCAHLKIQFLLAILFLSEWKIFFNRIYIIMRYSLPHLPPTNVNYMKGHGEADFIHRQHNHILTSHISNIYDTE